MSRSQTSPLDERHLTSAPLPALPTRPRPATRVAAETESMGPRCARLIQIASSRPPSGSGGPGSRCWRFQHVPPPIGRRSRGRRGGPRHGVPAARRRRRRIRGRETPSRIGPGTRPGPRAGRHRMVWSRRVRATRTGSTATPSQRSARRRSGSRDGPFGAAGTGHTSSSRCTVAGEKAGQQTRRTPRRRPRGSGSAPILPDS